MKEKVLKKANTKTKTHRLSGKRGKEASNTIPSDSAPLDNDSVSDDCVSKECVELPSNEVTIIEPATNQVATLWPAEGILRQALMSYSYPDEPSDKRSDEVKIISVSPAPPSTADLQLPSQNVIVIPNSNILVPLLPPSPETPTTKADAMKDARNVTVLYTSLDTGSLLEKGGDGKDKEVMYTYTTSYCTPSVSRGNELFVTANSQLHALLNTPVTTSSLHIRNGNALDSEVPMSLGTVGTNSLLNSLLNTSFSQPVAGFVADPDVPEILSQLGRGVLPTISSSQVSSVLSAIDASYLDTDPHNQGLEDASSKVKDDVIVVQVLDSPETENATPESRLRQGPVACFKCSHCPLLGLQPLVMAAHARSPHPPPAPRLHCPGCRNVFYSPTAASVHLSQDHGLSGSALKVVLASVLQAQKQAVEKESELAKPLEEAESSTLQVESLLRSKPLNEPPNKSDAALEKPDALDVSCLPQIDNVGGHLESEGLSIVVDLDARLLTECVKIRVRDLGKEEEFHDNASEPGDTDREDLDHILEEDIVVKAKPAALDACEFKNVDLVVNEEHVKKRGRPKGSRNLNPMNRPANDDEKSEKYCGYRCLVQDCLVRLQSHDNIEYHRRCHLNAGYECPECGLQMPAWNRLTTHLWRTHGIDMELYPCSHCTYKTASYSKLVNLHQRIHFDDRPFLCDSCGKGFKNTKQLRNHKVVHEGKTEGNKRCDVCSRSFASLRLLRLHQDNVHRKLRPHLCNFCGYSASSRSTLKMHMRQHTGEKPFECEECEYRTGDHNSLRRHKMRHSGNRPYKCPHCSYACIQSSTFKAHLNTKHPGQDNGLMFSCPKCPFRSVKKDNYTAHLAEHSRAKQKPEQAASPVTDMSLVANLDLLYVNQDSVGEKQIDGQVADLDGEEITADLREPREPKFKVADH